MKSKNYKQAFEWYVRSYHAAGASNKEHETAIILKISKSLRLQVEGSDQEYYRTELQRRSSKILPGQCPLRKGSPQSTQDL